METKSMRHSAKLFAAAALLSSLAFIQGCGVPFFDDPWEGTWWGVQDAGKNWSGDDIKNLEIFTFKKEGDTIAVEHRTQRGQKEIEGHLSGTAKVDGGRLLITPKDSKREVVFSFSRTGRDMETSLKNADGTPVTLKALTSDNNEDMEKIRSEIVKTFSKPENRVNTTIGNTR